MNLEAPQALWFNDAIVDNRGMGGLTRTRRAVLLVACTLSVSVALPANAFAAPYFAPTSGSPAFAEERTAAELGDGQALIVGSTGAQVFNPASNTFTTTTGTPTGYRAAAAAASLADGRVLVVGGCSPGISSPIQTAEIYDPQTGTFSPTGNMTTGRCAPAAASLPSGRVLVLGGQGGPTTAEIFNPQTGTFTPTGSLTAVGGRSSAAAAPLPDGRVLVAGGVNGSTPLATAEIYDPASGTFTPAGSMGTVRAGPGVAALPDGRVLVAGGYALGGYTVPINSAEIYDPATGAFAPTTSLGTARSYPGAAPLGDGRVLFAGGYTIAGAETFFTDALPKSAGVDFGARSVGTTTESLPLIVTNRGAQPLHIGGASSLVGGDSGSFAITNDACAATTLANAQSCRVDVRFTPTALGARETTLRIADDSPGAPHGFTVTGSGIAGPPTTVPAPDTKLKGHPKAKIKTSKRKVKVKFTFSSPDATARFACKLDKKAFATCRSPKTYRVKPGTHKFSVRATAGGVADPSPATFKFKVVRKH